MLYMQTMASNRVVISLSVIALILIASSFGYTLSADEMTYGGLALAGVGEIELKDFKELIEKQGRAFEEFKKANDERLKAVEEKGYAPADTVEKVDKINADMNELSKQLTEMAKKQNRPNVGADSAITDEQVEHKQAFRDFLRKGNDNGLQALERKAFQRGNDSEGGFFIDAEMDMDIDRVADKTSIIRNLASVRTIGSMSYKKRVKTSGMAARWVAEGEAGGETPTPKYATIEIVVEEMEIEPWVYNSSLEDADEDIYSDLVEEAGIAFGEAEKAFIDGDGIKKPRGFLSYGAVANSNYAWGKVGFVKSGEDGDFAATNPGDNIINLLHALRPAYRNGAVMLMSDTTLAKVRQMKDGTGNFYLFQPDPTGMFGGRVLGTPVQIDENMPDIAADNFAIAYANWMRAYRIVDRKGVTLIRDNITEKGTTKFNFRKRVGGGILNFEAIKLMKFSA